MIEVTTEDIVVDIVNNIDVSSTGNIDVVVEDNNELDITVAKKEFVITGDDIYVPVLYDDAPQWMKDLVEIAVAVSVETANTATLNQLTQILSEFATSYVPLNQYTQSILDLSDADERIHTLITTLNSNYNDGLSEANSQIIHLESTKASRTEVVAQVVDTIAAQLATPGSDIQSVIARLDQAIVTETQARAQSFQVLTSSLNNVGSDVTANASAIHSLNTYVGVSNGVPDGSGALADIVILQKQNDGVIETVTGTYDVMINPQDPNLAELVLTAEPYKTWKAADVTGMDTRLKHIGDVYIKYSVTSNGAREYVGSYKFIRTIVDASDAHKSTDADGFTWALIVDQAAQDAYNQALNAYDLADNKRRVFTTTPSGPYDIGDLWTKTVSGGSTLYKATVKRVSGYVAGDWVVADDAGLNTFVSTTYTPAVTSLQNQVDGKVESWYTLSTSDPKTAWTDAATRDKHDGDMWYQTDTFLSYWYSSTTHSWNLIEDKAARDALENAATAQTSANNAQTSANTANSLLADIASDNKLVASEKTAVKKEWDVIQSEYTKNLTQGTAYGVSTTAYTTAYNTLNSYITPLLANLTTTSDIVGTTFRSTFKAYYDANIDLLNAVANKINSIADGKINSYYVATLADAQTLSNGWTATEKTSNTGDLAVVWNDSTLDNNCTWIWGGSSWKTTRDKKLVSLASDVTTLRTDLNSGTGTWAAGDTQVTNTLTTTINGKVATVESKWGYNSTVNINGVYKKSGFGLTTNYTSGSGTEADPYVSEFWIDATRMKFTNSAMTGSKAPFTIESSGVIPEITFNGKVSFNNVTGVSGQYVNLIKNSEFQGNVNPWGLGYNPNGSILDRFNLAENVHDASWIIKGSTGSLTLHQSNRNSSTANDDTAIDLYPTYVYDSSKGYTVTAGQTYEFSVYTAAHRCDMQLIMRFFDSNLYDIGGISSGHITPTSGGNYLESYSRVVVRMVAPAGAVTALLAYRKHNTTAGSTDSWIWIARPFFGMVSANSSSPVAYVASDSVDGLYSAGTTTIDGGKITTGSIGANQINVNEVFAQNITYTGVITGGTGGSGGIIRSYNGNMVIDLVNGSIYIA